MENSLEKLFMALERQRKALLGELSRLSGNQLNQNNQGKWSIGQIAGHLITAEQLSLSYMTKKINAIKEVSNTGFWNEIKLVVFIISQRLPLKYKAPKNLGNNPKSYSDFNSLETDWEESRKGLKEFLEKFPEDGQRKRIYRHPVMGRCNVIHALKFFREHLIHHYPQIKRQL